MIKKKPLILIVDDTELNRAFLQDMLEADYDILEAADGVEAVAVIRQHEAELSLVLLDIVMPTLDGFEVLAMMQANHWIDEIPVVIISSETSGDYLTRGYELGAMDYISRPFDVNAVRRRVQNTIMLYAKQKNLQELVMEQIAEKEKNNAMMVDILSSIVEFRNGESGVHVLHIRIITETLLEELMASFPCYAISPVGISVIANAAAMHDVGKIVVPEEILNKPGRLTPEEFEIIKTHCVAGANMIGRLRVSKDEELIKHAYAICRWHHERWDGGGYPDGLKGMDIPVSAQVVALADVYDALVSPRVYKPALPHDEAIRMIFGGECGAFNPDLLECLQKVAPRLQTRIRLMSADQENLFNVREISREIISKRDATLSGRTVYLLEQERIKYQFLATLSNEILFEYDCRTDIATFSERARKELGIDMVVNNLVAYLRSGKIMSKQDAEDLIARIDRTTPAVPIISVRCLLHVDIQRARWYQLTMRIMWSSDESAIVGCIGKLEDVHEAQVESDRLLDLSRRDSLTNLLNHATFESMVTRALQENPNQHAMLVFLDIDNFKDTNDTQGHLFGDHVLKHVAMVIQSNIRQSDYAARLGGDEFAIFLQALPVQHMCGKVESLLRVLSEVYHDFSFSVSMGIACYPEDGREFRTLLHRADGALYVSKRAGKNRFTFVKDIADVITYPSALSDIDAQMQGGRASEENRNA